MYVCVYMYVYFYTPLSITCAFNALSRYEHTSMIILSIPMKLKALKCLSIVYNIINLYFKGEYLCKLLYDVKFYEGNSILTN